MPVTTAARPAAPPPVLPPEQQSDFVEFSPHPAVTAQARLRTRRALRAWGLGELAADAAQIASELVCNAVQAHRREHLTGPVRLTLQHDRRTVLIAVRDDSASPPVPGTPGSDAEHGRGLAIVSALSTGWTWRPEPGGGKTVRATLHPAREATA